jgi:hypothetical protein
MPGKAGAPKIAIRAGSTMKTPDLDDALGDL